MALMPIIMGAGKALFGGAAASAGASIGESLFSKKQSTNQPNQDGISGAIGGQEEQANQPVVELAGTMAKDAGKQLIQGAVDKGVQSILGDTPATSGEAGKAQREYMDNAYPDLNQWEQAGASAAGQGAEAAGAQMQMQMQQQQLRTQERIAKDNNDTALKTTGITSHVARQNNIDDNTRQTPLTTAQTEEAYKRIDNITQQIGLSKSQQKEIASRIEQQQKANSPYGKILHDMVGHLNSMGYDTSKMNREKIEQLYKEFTAKTSSKAKTTKKPRVPKKQTEGIASQWDAYIPPKGK